MESKRARSPKTQPLPAHKTKISYILDKKAKPRLERAAEKLGVSMSEVITRALDHFYKLKTKEAA